MRVDRRNISGAGSVLPADAAPHAIWCSALQAVDDGRSWPLRWRPRWVCRGAAA